MKFLSRKHRIFAYSEPVDMRKSFNGLQYIVRSHLKSDPLSGDIYLFVNKSGNYLKALLWDRTGYVIIAKKLERGRFSLPRSPDRGSVEVSEKILLLLFDGIRV